MLALRWVVVAAVAALYVVGPGDALAAPKPQPVDWNGYYVGGNGGYSWGYSSETATAAPVAGFASLPSTNFDGWFGGLQGGRDWRRDNWVFGIEGDWQLSGERSYAGASGMTGPICESGCDRVDVFTQSLTGSRELQWFSTLRPRLGMLIDPATLIYGTAGVALGQFAFATQSSVTCQRIIVAVGTPCSPPPGAPTVGTSNVTEHAEQFGWTVGGGLERRLDEDWSLKLEYLYVDYGSHVFAGNAVDAKLTDQILRVGLNYFFH